MHSANISIVFKLTVKFYCSFNHQSSFSSSAYTVIRLVYQFKIKKVEILASGQVLFTPIY